jgi:hypothetical protein
MNSWAPDITSCTPSRFARPSSDAQQGFKSIYGLPAAVDVGITPIIQTGSLLSGGWSVQNSTHLVSRDRTSLAFPIKFTFMNMRDAWPHATVRVAFYLPNNATLSSDDTRLNSTSLTATFAGAIDPYTLDAIS